MNKDKHMETGMQAIFCGYFRFLEKKHYIYFFCFLFLWCFGGEGFFVTCHEAREATTDIKSMEVGCLGRGTTAGAPPGGATEHGTDRQRKGGTKLRKTTDQCFYIIGSGSYPSLRILGVCRIATV